MRCRVLCYQSALKPFILSCTSFWFADRLVEALEDYEGGDVDAYSDMSADQSLLSGGHKRRVRTPFLIIGCQA